MTAQAPIATPSTANSSSTNMLRTAGLWTGRRTISKTPTSGDAALHTAAGGAAHHPA
eukprot:CAMPEP_0185317656 /NCGR_PEP_ID=MMETSP1363-20130426/47309_1 /TAXON_ID=38817 /ORGANISM="Gephyrocapsa oceanica, Strain RCC1303" /LENGTH=56 /DNA_ID=CAMNT_0027915913 /DNA_START=27 /DNA_END=194 /DNA_ORIENTATION=-